MERVLVTGGAGFIGSHIAEFYAKSNNKNEIVILDNFLREKLFHNENFAFDYNWEYLHRYNNIKFYKEDIRNLRFLKTILRKYDFSLIFHSAGQTAVTTSIKKPYLDFKVNTIGTVNLLEAARMIEIDPIMLLASTNKVFGNNVNQCKVIEKETRYEFSDDYSNGISESFPVDHCDHTPYGTSKLCADQYFQEYGSMYGLNTGIFRMSCIYGERQFGVEAQGWISHFILSAIRERKITIFGNGKQVRDILYISDLLSAFNAYIKNYSSVNKRVFCIGGGAQNAVSILEVIAILEKLLKKPIRYEFFDWRPKDQKIYISDITRAKELLSWKPQFSPNEGIKRVVKWMKRKKKNI
ncbi:MAG: Nucleoside-diphosphate sugar epimerase [Promethearchaeota archaeon]|nr:MAG: Nucleoside-diphosphate sugar epimerase [Candidatus Lokiarchaeota archaeon]